MTDDWFLTQRTPVPDSETTVARVALALPVKDPFDYMIPEHLASKARIGSRVRVKFRSRTVTGYVIDVKEGSLAEGLKEIEEILDPEPLFHAGLVRFLSWAADYYLFPIGRFIQAALPGGLNVRPFVCCELTPSGAEVLAMIGTKSDEGKTLAWIRENPDKRIPRELRDGLPSLQKRGWISVGEKFTKRRAGPLMKRFVRPRPGVDLDSILKNHPGGPRVSGEEEFLAAILGAGETARSAICRRFPKGAYLCRKWVGKGVLEECVKPVLRDLAGNLLPISPLPERLFPQQETALKSIAGHLEKRHFAVCLLHGVTSSGKTEVYYEAVKKAMDLGRQAILMLPEIALTVYLEGIFRSRIGNRVAVYHSGLSDGERFDQWMRMARGEVDLVIGARSALFAPLQNLGLIIVDEEHDHSYKQDEGPRYQARDAAVVRGKIEKAVVVLGSATPSVQSFYNAATGKYHLLSMPDRVENRPMPAVRVVDMKTIPGGEKEHGIITPLLRKALVRNLAEGRQAMLFLNRRGFHRIHLCRHCGQVLRCPNCDLALVHHLRDGHLACHYCGYRSELRKTCPACLKEGMRSYGFGTERLEMELKEQCPGGRTARLDRDSTRAKGEIFRILKAFSEKEVDFLVGTQMITKGYDFPGVTLVGVISADSTLGFPDFRAAERTFQLLSQVAGRAGRGADEGEVVVQTFNPDHYAVTSAKNHDYRSFYEKEKALREQLGYPPFSYLACLRLQGAGEKETDEAAQRMSDGIRQMVAKWPRRGKELQVLGPAEAPIAKLKGKYRRQILLKSKGAGLLHYLLREIEAMSRNILKPTRVDLVIDVDPYQML
jgi:primosomal protein N' (replication factor Y) (superfamily II helicase)